MVDIKHANAYSEVLAILEHISKEEYHKIPKTKINVFTANCNKDYVFHYDPDKTLEEQNVSKTARVIIAILFRDYWATPEQREKILAKEKQDMQKLEEEKSEKYSYDNLFKKQAGLSSIQQDEAATKMFMVEYKKETFFSRIVNKIKSLFCR